MNIIGTGLIRGNICCIVEHGGFSFYLSSGGAVGYLAFTPDFSDAKTKTAIINQDKSFIETYSFLVKEYPDDVLDKLWIDLYGAMRIVKKEPNYYDPAYGFIDNGVILNILENELIQQSVKDKVLDNCEWVYLVGNTTEGKYKIGMTRRNPTKRVNEFSPLLPFKTKIFAKCPTPDAYELEKELHSKFRSKCTNGEWFELSEGDVIYIASMSIEVGNHHGN